MKIMKQVNKETGEIMSQVIEAQPRGEVKENHPTGLNSDTGERNFASLENAMTIVTSYMSEQAPAFTPKQLAEDILKGSVTRGLRTTFTESDLRDKTCKVADGVTNLVRGWFKSNENLITGGKFNSQWFALSVDGDQANLCADRVCIVEAPVDTVLRNKCGKFVMLRFTADGGDFTHPRTGKTHMITYDTSVGKDGRVWFTADGMPWQCLQGVVASFSSLEHAKFTLDELSQALYTLKMDAQSRDLAEVPSEWEAELQAIDLAEKRLASVPMQEAQF